LLPVRCPSIAEADGGTPEDRIHALDYLVYAHLQLAQDAKAKEAFDLALKIENDLVARKHDSGLGSRCCITALPPIAEVHPRSCYVAEVPQAVMPPSARWRC
jgi:hypothetical protein